MKNQLIRIMTLGVLAAAVSVPAIASAEGYRDHRDEVRDTWKGLTLGSALVGIAGLASGDRDVAIAGAIGTVYSAYRLSADGCEHRREVFVIDRAHYAPIPTRYRFRDHDWRHR
jgi:hypothetical protein